MRPAEEAVQCHLLPWVWLIFWRCWYAVINFVNRLQIAGAMAGAVTAASAIANVLNMAWSVKAKRVHLLCLLIAAVGPTSADAFALNSMEHRPTYGKFNQFSPPPPKGKSLDMGPPIDNRQHRLNVSGDDPDKDSSVIVSRFTYVGCFKSSKGNPNWMTYYSQGFNFDPNECLDLCVEQNPDTPSYDIIFAVHFQTCACVIVRNNNYGVMTNGFEPAESDNKCEDFSCKLYQNPICGGNSQVANPMFGGYWGVFREYDFQSLSSQGAYDPWRYIWYTLVTIRESNIRGGFGIPDSVVPERYYLHAVDPYTGKAQFQYMLELQVLIYGLQYDLDSTRLVGLSTALKTGRIRDNIDWVYKLTTILINTTKSYRPYMQVSHSQPLDVTIKESKEYLGYNGATGIMSRNNIDMFIFTQVNPAAAKRHMKDIVYFTQIETGFILRREDVDFKVTQLFVNEKYGDVSAIGPKLSLEIGKGGQQTYVYFARIYRSEISNLTLVDWRYNPVSPIKLAEDAVVGDFELYPGVSASEHLFNKSAIAYRFVPPKDPQFAAFTIFEVNIRTKGTKNWCDEEDGNICQGTIYYETPYAGIYNREPGIPLSLKSPSLLEARFTIEALTIIVTFDRSTLKGAKQIDENNDYLPDYVNESYAPDGRFDCGRIFNDETVLLLGPWNEEDYADPNSASCKWESPSKIKIFLPRVLNITTGDSIFLRKDTVYAVPLGYPNNPTEWSPAATGGIEVDVPKPLEAPGIIVVGTEQIDACNDVYLDAGPSLARGKWQAFDWVLKEPTQDEPNPLDLTNDPTRTYDQAKIEELKRYLNETSYNNSEVLSMPSNVLEESSQYTILLTVGSRWELNTTKVLEIIKLGYAKPSVSIQGQSVRTQYRTDSFSLIADGQPSTCADASTILEYRWSVTTGNLDFAAFDYIPQDPEGTPSGSTLAFNAFTLTPPTDDDLDYNEYNFTVSCYVEGTAPTLENTAYASVTVRVPRSDIYVVMATEDRMISRSDNILVLDARKTQDPDNPTPDGQTFKGTFEWYCLLPDRTPCFPPSTTGLIDPDTIQLCRTDPNQRITDGGETFFLPLFDDTEYCEAARGVMMFKTEPMVMGEYKYTVFAESYDGRTASKDVYIQVTELDVPKILLEIVNPKDKYPVSQTIQIRGTETGTKLNGTRVYSWNVLMFQTNPEYLPELADAQDPSNPYNVDQYTYVDVTDKYNTSDFRKFQANPDLPTLVVKPNALAPSAKYRFKLNVDLGEAIGYASIAVETAGLPPMGGSLRCTPRNATMDTPRFIEAPDWGAEDLPLSYDFGYLTVGATAVSAGRKSKFTTGSSPVKNIERPSLVIGEESTNYTLILFVEVSTPYGAVTEAQYAVQSLPPENLTQATLDAVENAANADGAEVLNALGNAFSLDPTNPEVQADILNILNDKNDEIPQQPSDAMKNALLLNELAENGATGSDTMDLLEDLTVNSAANGFFRGDGSTPEEGQEMASVMFGTMGNLLPTDENGMFGQGASTILDKHSHVDPDFNPFGIRVNYFESQSHGNLVERHATRAWLNHKIPLDDSNVINECETPFCDRPLLTCVVSEKRKSRTVTKTCCNLANRQTLCDHPPCWYDGLKCPTWNSGRGPTGAQQARRLQSRMKSKTREESQTRLANKKAQPRKHNREQVEKPESTWFTAWSNYNSPMRPVEHHEASDWDRTGAYFGWHPDASQRRLQYAAINITQSAVERLIAIEQDEKPLISQARSVIRESESTDMEALRADADEQMSFYGMSPRIAEQLRNAKLAEVKQESDTKFERERNASQRITRINVMRDTISKQLIEVLLPGDTPLDFETTSFTLYVGKSTNLSSVFPKFVFPKQFQVPADSPDNPTPENNVTGFAFQYIEYSTNIYSWSDSTPQGSNVSRLVTLIVLKANTNDLEERRVPEPIRIFADRELFSEVMCLYWDRFAPNTAGGSWSTEGIMNDGRGCITSHLSDIGIFLDGEVPKGTLLVDAASRWEREVWESTCIGCGDTMNYVVVAVLGMVLFTNMLLIMLGYVVDETKRTDMEKAGIASRYHLDGDGLNSAMNVDDPIAYSLAHTNPVPLMIGTFVNVIKREHALISVIFYHENFTRPQRLQCFLALVIGILAINASVQSQPGYMQEIRTWFIPGVLSGLLLFPVYSGLLIMFNVRPRAVKKKLIKRATSTKESDLILAQREKLEHQTSLKPPPGYGMLPPTTQFAPGGTSVLNFPSPLPLPPIPPAKVGGTMGGAGRDGNAALPPLPPSLPGMAKSSGLAAMGGQLALPALPGMTANLPLPPPPRYPPPAKALQMTTPETRLAPLPDQFPKVGPPPNPFLQLPPPAPPDNDYATNQKALTGGAFDAGANFSNAGRAAIGETGSTPLELRDRPGPATPPGNANNGSKVLEDRGASTGGASPRQGNDVEASAALPGTFVEDPEPGMAPGDGGDASPLPKPAGTPGALTPPGTPPVNGSGRNTPVPVRPGGGGGTPSATPPASVTPRSARPRTPTDQGAGVGNFSPASTSRTGILRLPPAVMQEVTQGDGPMPLFIRAQPPPDLKAPFSAAPTGPMGLPIALQKLQGAPHPSMVAPVASAKGPGLPPTGAPLPPLVPPPPPPPPREEDAAFVRRIRYTYYDKVAREHDKVDLLEDMEELGRQTPPFVYDVMTTMPYIACCTFTLCSIFVNLQYGVKFARWQEEYWIKGSLVGLGLVLALLETFRIVMMTLVELRKYENRKKSKAGVFLPRRVPSEMDKGRQIAPPPRLYKNATARTKVPLDAKIKRPQFPPKAMRGPGEPPVAPPPPGPPPPRVNTTFSNTARSIGSGSQPGGVTPPGGATPPGGTPRSDRFNNSGTLGRSVTPPASGSATPLGLSGSRGPALRVGEQRHNAMPPGWASPASANSQTLTSLNKAMNMQVQAGARRHQTPPPPPPGKQGPAPARGGGLPPPPPAAARPTFSRPSSAGSGAAAKRGGVPPPPRQPTESA